MGHHWFDNALLVSEVGRQFEEIGISTSEYVMLTEAEVATRDRRAPFAAVFLGYEGAASVDHPELAKVIEDSLPIIPCVANLDGYSGKVPFELAAVNGLAIGQDALLDVARLVTCIFENMCLLRAERRVFISYRRTDTREIALQLYDALQQRCFDTFLDTHSIQPAVDMQEHLWHRLADSDVVILLDSPDFRSSRWTLEEQARANSTSVQILHLLWPTVDEDPYSALSEFHKLNSSDFYAAGEVGPTARLLDQTVADICVKVESVRASALALRYAYLVDQFCDLCRDTGIPVTVHPERYVSTEKDGAVEIFVPAVGVPNAYRIHQIEKAVQRNQPSSYKLSVVFDNRGLLKGWVGHLEWLNSHLKVRSLAATDLKTYVEGLA
jgi:hypothetical protein